MRALVALGSNLGDRRANLEAGLAALGGLGSVTVSPLWSETPDESGLGPDYLNTVALLETSGEDPRALLEALLRAELCLGRDRGQGRNAPRTLDLDLVAVRAGGHLGMAVASGPGGAGSGPHPAAAPSPGAAAAVRDGAGAGAGSGVF